MSLRSSTRSLKRKGRRRMRKAVAEVPGPSTNPATNLLILDIAMRGASFFAARQMEKGLLRVRYNAEKASDIVQGRSWLQAAAANAAARTASRSVPGLLLVTAGVLAKSIFDRALSPRESTRRGDKALRKQAESADEE